MFGSASGFLRDQDSSYGGVTESQLRWLRGTRQLDVMSTALRTRVIALTQLLYTDSEKAIAIHDFVKNIPFSCEADDAAITASSVLKRGHGDAFSKGILFVAMLRSANIPARLRIVSLPTHFLRGLVSSQFPTTLHVMSEVRLHQTWWVTDTYISDLLLQAATQELLREEGKTLGYGLHANAPFFWDGKSHASTHCCVSEPQSLPLIDWGVADDVESFYSDHSNAQLNRGVVDRLKWRIAAAKINRRIEAIRAGRGIALFADTL